MPSASSRRPQRRHQQGHRGRLVGRLGHLVPRLLLAAEGQLPGRRHRAGGAGRPAGHHVERVVPGGGVEEVGGDRSVHGQPAAVHPEGQQGPQQFLHVVAGHPRPGRRQVAGGAGGGQGRRQRPAHRRHRQQVGAQPHPDRRRAPHQDQPPQRAPPGIALPAPGEGRDPRVERGEVVQQPHGLVGVARSGHQHRFGRHRQRRQAGGPRLGRQLGRRGPRAVGDPAAGSPVASRPLGDLRAGGRSAQRPFCQKGHRAAPHGLQLVGLKLGPGGRQVPASEDQIVHVDVERDVTDQGDDGGVGPGPLLVLGQALAELGRELVEVREDAVEVAVVVEQLGRRLLPHPRDAGQVVRGVAPQRGQHGVGGRVDAGALADPLPRRRGRSR